jgi:hypothetical protein
MWMLGRWAAGLSRTALMPGNLLRIICSAWWGSEPYTMALNLQ